MVEKLLAYIPRGNDDAAWRKRHRLLLRAALFRYQATRKAARPPTDPDGRPGGAPRAGGDR